MTTVLYCSTTLNFTPLYSCTGLHCTVGAVLLVTYRLDLVHKVLKLVDKSVVFATDLYIIIKIGYCLINLVSCER